MLPYIIVGSVSFVLERFITNYKPHKDIHELSTEISPFLHVCRAS